jgi:hypothetical protein
VETVFARQNQCGSLMSQFKVSASARTHILMGDIRGGGHRFGANRGKSEFPRFWPDDAIIAAIEDVANDPASTRMQGRGAGQSGECSGRTMPAGLPPANLWKHRFFHHEATKPRSFPPNTCRPPSHLRSFVPSW